MLLYAGTSLLLGMWLKFRVSLPPAKAMPPPDSCAVHPCSTVLVSCSVVAEPHAYTAPPSNAVALATVQFTHRNAGS